MAAVNFFYGIECYFMESHTYHFIFLLPVIGYQHGCTFVLIVRRKDFKKYRVI